MVWRLQIDRPKVVSGIAIAEHQDDSAIHDLPLDAAITQAQEAQEKPALDPVSSEDELATATTPPRRASFSLPQQQQRQQLPSGHYSTTEIRRPQHRNKYYSHSTTEVAWLRQKADRLTVLSHVGRIEELDDGVVAPQACDRCNEKDLICRCYSAVARTKYQAAGSGYGCARCRFDVKTCSIQVAARAAGGATKPQRENMTSPREKIARQEARIFELELKLAWS
ncbi:hypothetical protein KC330_g7551 [Hortaea werneckii]|nr:hypothetical protein KC330_g7551 [Hortaea werneckii]